MGRNSLYFHSEESSYIDTLVMKLLKSGLDDDHDVFGAYVAMEMRNLQSSDAQKKLRGEIRDSISRVVREECMTKIDQEESVTTIDYTNTSNLRFKVDANNSKREDDISKTNSSNLRFEIDENTTKKEDDLFKTNTSSLRFKIDENNSKREDDILKINNSSSADIFNVDTVSQENGNNSWELIN